MTNEDIEDSLKNMVTRKEKENALKLQINFRKKVLKQNHNDKSVFQFSHNRKVFSVNQLKQNLLQLLPLESSPQYLSAEEIFADPDLLIYRRIEHLFECDGELIWYKGTVLGYDFEKKFRVAYEQEDEEYSFDLLEDLENNELYVFK